MPSLTRVEAAERADLLSVHSYTIDLDVTAVTESDTFDSVTTIAFACERPGAETFLELKPARLDAVTLNGEPVEPTDLVGNRLPLRALAAENEIVVRARMAYSRTGEGLHRFTDPEDGAVYLYGQEFLDDAQTVFACFDQPDLKAPVTLSISAPEGWEVAANAPGVQVRPGRWEFTRTPPLATYFVTLLAGPYHVVGETHDGIPLALYCRRSLAAHLDKDAAEIFDITRGCLDRFHELFGVRYPFGKYDQAFVPEFNAGAMENPGLVTIRDEFVFRSAVSDADRELRARVIAHEMAHMWFGDLVTMQWWDDLWLNESFAEYMGHRVAAEGTRFTECWVDFAVGRKGWGYAADQRPSTHPVAPVSLPDAGLALLNFDGISYAKGAAVLRQLAEWIGDDAFLAALRAHFAAHAYGNATLADLLAALSASSGRDLDPWAEVWLRHAQVNTIRPEITIGADGRYTEVTVVQAAPASHPTLRPHRIGIGVYRDGIRQAGVAVDLDPDVDGGRTPVPALAGVPAGDLLLLNDGDLTWAKIRFDPADAARLPQVLPGLRDPLARALVWGALLDAIRDAELPAAQLAPILAAGLPAETALSVFRDVVRSATELIGTFLPPSAQPAVRAELAAACRAAMTAAEPGGGHQLVAALGFLASAAETDVPELRGWLDGSAAPNGLEIDAELRWSTLLRLAVLGHATEADIDAEYQGDHTAAGAEHAARCRAARPDPAAKAEAWRVIVADDELSHRLVVAAAEGFWHPEQADLTASYVDRYFAEMPAMAARRTPQAVVQVAEAAYPCYAVAPQTLAAAERLLDRSDVAALLRRVVLDATDDLRRALDARTLADPARREEREHARDT